MSTLQLPVSWMRNQETHLNDINVLISSLNIHGIHDDTDETEFSELCLCGPGVCESCAADGSWLNLGDWRFTVVRLLKARIS